MLHRLHPTMWSSGRDPHHTLKRPRGGDQWHNHRRRSNEGTPEARTQETVFFTV